MIVLLTGNSSTLSKSYHCFSSIAAIMPSGQLFSSANCKVNAVRKTYNILCIKYLVKEVTRFIHRLDDISKEVKILNANQAFRLHLYLYLVFDIIILIITARTMYCITITMESS